MAASAQQSDGAYATAALPLAAFLPPGRSAMHYRSSDVAFAAVESSIVCCRRRRRRRCCLRAHEQAAALLQADAHLPIDMLRLVLRALIGDEPLEAYRLCRHLQVWLGCHARPLWCSVASLVRACGILCRASCWCS